MESEITLTFYRNSRNTKKLAGIVKDFSHYELAEDIQDPCFVYINKNCHLEDFRLFVYLWDIVRKNKETAILVNGKMLTREQAESILDWVRCYCNHIYWPDQTDYCYISPGFKALHGWGCKWLHSVMRHKRFGRHNGIAWYCVGPFDGTIQYIDKQDIKDKLLAEMKEKSLELCPLFLEKKIIQFVDMLPDQIDPMVDSGWEHRVSLEPETMGEVIGVQPKQLTIFDLLLE